MVRCSPGLLLAGLLILLAPGFAQARLTLGWVPGAAILGSEDQARRLAAHLEARLAEPVVLRSCADEAQLHQWLHRYRMVDLASLSRDYLRGVPPGELLPVADLHSGSATATLVLRQGLRSDQQLQLRTLLVQLPEDPAGRDLLAAVGGLRLNSTAGTPRVPAAATPAPPSPAVPRVVLWPDQRPPQPPEPEPLVSPESPSGPDLLPEKEELAVTSAGPAREPVATAPALIAEPVVVEAPGPGLLPTPPPAAAAEVVVEDRPPAAVLPEPVVAAAPSPTVVSAPAKPVEAVEPLAALPLPAPQAVNPPPPPEAPARLALLPPKPPVVPPLEVGPKLSEQTVSRSLSSGRAPLADGAPRQTIYLVPFTTIMVPAPVAETIFDQFVETLNQRGGPAGYEFVILKDELERVDPTWLRKATYVTGEIFGYVEESGCCSTDIRSKSRLALYRPGSSEPKLRHEYPAKAFFDHDYSTLDAERKKLAERISLDLSSRLLQALAGG